MFRRFRQPQQGSPAKPPAKPAQATLPQTTERSGFQAGKVQYRVWGGKILAVPDDKVGDFFSDQVYVVFEIFEVRDISHLRLRHH